MTSIDAIELLDTLIHAGKRLSGSALQLLLVHTRECIATGGDSTLTLEEAARAAGISTSSAQKQLRFLAVEKIVRRIRFGRNTHVRVLNIPGLVLRGQEDLPLREPAAANQPPSPLPPSTKMPTEDPAPGLAEKIAAAKAERDKVSHEWTRQQHDILTAKALADRYGQLSTLIERLEAQQEKMAISCPTPSIESTTPLQEEGTTRAEGSARRPLPKHLEARIRATVRRLPGISSPAQLVDEIKHQVECGAFREKDPLHAVNICLKLVRENRWTTPWDYAQRLADKAVA